MRKFGYIGDKLKENPNPICFIQGDSDKEFISQRNSGSKESQNSDRSDYEEEQIGLVSKTRLSEDL